MLEDMRVVDLKAELKTRGLPVSGLKAVLIQRLQDHDGKTTPTLVGDSDSNIDQKREPTVTPKATDENNNNDNADTEEEKAVLPPKDGVGAGVTALSGAAAAVAAVAAAAGEKEGPAAAAAAPAASAVTGDPSQKISSADASSASSTAANPQVKPTTTPALELKSTRSKTRRASMAAAAARPAAGAAAVKKKSAKSATAVVAGNAVPASGNPTIVSSSPVGEGGGGGAGAAAAAAGAGAGGAVVDENSKMQIMLAKGAGLFGIVVSAACIGCGDGLTAGNLATVHVALAGLLIAAIAANTRPAGGRAFAARALVTLAVAIVATEALQQAQRRQQQQKLGASPDGVVGVGVGGGMAALLALVSEKVAAAAAAAAAAGLSCKPVEGGGGDGDGAGAGAGEDEVACTAAMAPALEALLAWGNGAWSVMASGEWRAVRFEVIEFWGWASVAGYLALVEALPVMLRPLHAIFRRLERGHNILLSLTSLAMLVGIVRSCITSGKTSSVHAMLCGAFDEEDPVFDVTSKVFFWSKAWEWFDTALLVAKGKPVSWLQYTHHASTAILTALNMVPTRNAMWSVVCSLNSFVHAWMYAYYGLPRFGLLRRSKVWLTWAQMLQHVTVLASATYVVYMGHTGEECHNNTTPILAGLGLYLMYLVFFALFYRRTYLSSGEAENKPKAA